MSTSNSNVRMDLKRLKHLDDQLRNDIEGLFTFNVFEFNDGYGNYKIRKVPEFKNYIEDKCYRTIVIDPKIDVFDFFLISNYSKELLVIGSANYMSKAKEICEANKLRLITVPTVLSNDAFATNRVDQDKGGESLKSVYPIETVFVTDILLKAPIETHLLGVGEILSLYTSMIDYLETESNSSTEISLEKLYFCNIARKVLCINRNNSNESIINSLIKGLVYKTLLMRFQKDHTIGAGIDHILSRVLERKFGWPHGKSCILSLIVSLLLFPNWQCDLFAPSLLLKKCIDLELINKAEIELLAKLDFQEWANEALSMRPSRKTCLKNLSRQSYNIAKERFSKLNYGIH